MWKLHQLMGALEINVRSTASEARAEEHNRLTFMVMLGLFAVGVLSHRFLVVATWRAARILTRQLAWRASPILSPDS